MEANQFTLMASQIYSSVFSNLHLLAVNAFSASLHMCPTIDEVQALRKQGQWLLACVQLQSHIAESSQRSRLAQVP